MTEIFDKEIRAFFPFSPYKMQIDFMKILYNVLKSSNINSNENVHIFLNFINENENIKRKLEKSEDSVCSDILSTYKEVKSHIREIRGDENYEHIICEMKTGSGKTLTLLSSVVYWYFYISIQQKDNKLNKKPKWVRERVVEKFLQKYWTMLKTENEKKRKDEEILNHYFKISDEKIVLRENVCIRKRKTKVEKQTVTEDSIIKEKYDDSMSDTSIEGETKKQIFICSRTQSQLNQYFHELKKIEKKVQDKISVNMILIGSRKHLCINDDFLRKHKGMDELNDCCKSSHCKYKTIFSEQLAELMKKKKKKKIFYESSDSSSSSSENNSRIESEENESIEKINNYSLVTKLLNRKNVNMDEIKEICKNEQIEICPYYLNRENVKNADIVLLPYICILNKNIRTNLKINIKENIVIFDESQNIIENINDCNSTLIKYYQVKFCKLILNEYIKKYKTVLNNNNMVMIKQISVYCNLLMNVFNECEKNLPVSSSATVGEHLNYSKNQNSGQETKRNLDHLKTYTGTDVLRDTSVELKEKAQAQAQEKRSSRIININKFNILSKIDAVNLNSLSTFLSNSLFCRKIRIFAESYIQKNFKNLKNSPNFNANALTTAIYSLNEFTSTLINTNKYDYVFINDGVSEVGSISDNELKKEKRPEKEENRNKIEEHNKTNVMNIPYLKYKKRIQTHQTYTCSKEEQGKKRKKEATKKEGNIDEEERESEERKDESFFLFKQLLDDFLKRKKEMFKTVEIISVSSCNNFQKIVKDCKNIILIGGTLHPLEEFLLLFLNEKKNKIKLFSADYVFKKDNIFSRIINRSIITNELIDNTFKNRFNKKHLLNLAIQIYILTLNTNFGNIIFFPSYKFLKVFTNFLNKEGNYVLGKMIKKKIILFEKKSDNSVLKEYIEHIKTIKEQDPSRRIKNGCVLFCVMNAKLSEGINFHDEYCRNIIIIGIPFFKFENKESNNFVLDRNSLVLEYYKNYSKEISTSEEMPTKLLSVEDVNRMCKTYQVKYAMKIVNQCIGRSMRHVDDFSSFFFLDFRFSKKEIYENFPSFIKRHIDSIEELSIEKNDSLFLELRQFFTDSYNDFKNYYTNNFSDLKFDVVDVNRLNMFVKDLYSLSQFHQKMNNV